MPSVPTFLGVAGVNIRALRMWAVHWRGVWHIGLPRVTPIKLLCANSQDIQWIGGNACAHYPTLTPRPDDDDHFDPAPSSRTIATIARQLAPQIVHDAIAVVAVLVSWMDHVLTNGLT